MRIVFLAAMIFGTVACATAGMAAEADPDRQTPVLLVGPDIMPYIYTDDLGQPAGIVADHAVTIMQESGLEYRIQAMPWSRAYGLAMGRVNTLIMMLSRTAEREKTFHWLHQLSRERFEVYGYRPRMGDVRTVDDLTKSGQAVACSKNSIQCDVLMAAGIPEECIVKMENQKNQPFLRLARIGRFTYFIAVPDMFTKQVEALGLDKGDFASLGTVGDSVPLYIAAHIATDPTILDRIRHAIDRLNRRGMSLKIDR